ncbi:LysM peptidoglycan-binding domain-containing protein [Mesorhizobium tamadayense]|uniref:LysM peptidoglycan-binding domain-containing protein n=1 Tax=Mesorhizobium tamadayense TaxID=425306 RepID=A0A3P3G4V7_9HYPH|nr:LysM peptidoglycan-binding domain-containing protein [Mesorhizobium tamadayense]RRI05895.1 LysM peptidoglycan-binding domain-containing protein [Mesorhizobium tamadayense]
MAINPSRAFLFAAGGVAVVAAVAYGSGALDPYVNNQKPAQVAALPQAGTKPADASSTSTEARLPQTQAPASTMAPANKMAPANNAMAPANDATAPAASAPAAQAPAAGPILPTFDVVRVEGNGSIVVAGSAAPNAKVEILNGGTVLGSTDAGPDSAFAVVLDDPLKPGDYTITLRSTVGGVAVASAQTAVVSVPQSPTGQVLAMVEEPGKPSELLTIPQPEAKPAAPAATGQAAAPAQTPAADAPTAAAPAATDQAADAATPPPAATAGEPKIAVEAVEIDRSKIFVAGTADPGRKVRAYADDILLGEAKTSPDGHFLIEAARDIPVGNHTIHVDGLDNDGAKVVARAAVPFEREPGESVAAVAPNETKPAASQSTEAKPAAAAPAATGTKPAETTAPGTSTAEAGKPAPSAGAPADGAEATPSAGVPETVAPKLEHADGAVIIRRNDTLWRISRRVYGHGVRYSTIYLANQDQIRDPDRIWPGQVFKVPGKSKEGEAADMKALGDQVTTAPAKAE